MYIKYFLVLLALAEAWESTTDFPQMGRRKSTIYAQYFMEFNSDIFKKALIEHRAFYAPNIANLKMVENTDLKLEKVRNYLKSAINNITDYISVIQTSKNTPIEGPLSEFGIEFPNENVVNSLYLLLENVAFFGDMYFNFPEMTLRILKEERGWYDILDTAYYYIPYMSSSMDLPTFDVIAEVRKILR